MYAHLHSAKQGSLAAQKYHRILPIAARLCQISHLSARFLGKRLCPVECWATPSSPFYANLQTAKGRLSRYQQLEALANVEMACCRAHKDASSLDPVQQPLQQRPTLSLCLKTLQGATARRQSTGLTPANLSVRAEQPSE